MATGRITPTAVGTYRLGQAAAVGSFRPAAGSPGVVIARSRYTNAPEASAATTALVAAKVPRNARLASAGVGSRAVPARSAVIP